MSYKIVGLEHYTNNKKAPPPPEPKKKKQKANYLTITIIKERFKQN